MDKDQALYAVRHSLAHILAQAVEQKFPHVKLGFGPPTEHGFYYDFDFGPIPLAEDDLHVRPPWSLPAPLSRCIARERTTRRLRRSARPIA